jgi:hypothetical protein
MKLPWRGVAVLAAASVPFLTTGASSWPFGRGPAGLGAADSSSAQGRAQNAISDWPEQVRDLAELVIQEYGPPDAVEPARLSWQARGPWRAIVVLRDSPGAVLEESVAYEVPVRRWRALGAFDRGVDYDPVKRRLIARTDREETNFLALNLADEIVRGRRTPAEAREFYDTVYSLSLAGKSSPYMERLLFRPQDEVN